jgi:hypothetical protein
MKINIRALAAALGLIGLGASLGVQADRRWLARNPQTIESPGQVRGRMIEDLVETVGLTDSQVARVHEIMNRYQITVTSAWDELQPELKTALDSAFVQINMILDPEQAIAFHNWFAMTHPRPAIISP